MEKRTKMPNSERAKQFAPFDALKGLQDALRIKEYEHDRLIKGDLSSEQIEKMSKILLNINKKTKIKVYYFDDGFYFDITGCAKIDFANRLIKINDKKIEFENIFDIEIVEN